MCEVTPKLAQIAAARLAFDEGIVGWEQVVQRADIDAVIIATPPDLHSSIAIAALEAGKHVLCEKPLARTAGGGGGTSGLSASPAGTLDRRLRATQSRNPCVFAAEYCAAPYHLERRLPRRPDQTSC